jgi:MFS transporter, OFA family, oxalate/formate antiporter
MDMNASPDKNPGKRGKIFYGWWIVLVSAILSFINGGTFYYGFTVFFNPIRQTFNWTSAETSIAFTVQRLESGIASPIVGFLVDRVGPRLLMVGGWIVVGLGFILMSRIHSLWTFIATFLVISIGFSFGSFVTVNATIANWFNKKRSRALTTVYVGYGTCGLIVPLLALAVTRFGWRETLTTIGIASWVIGIPLSLLMRHKPTQYGYLPDGASLDKVEDNSKEGTPANKSVKYETGLSVTETLKTRAFWFIAFALFFQAIGQSALTVHIVPYLESVKIPTQLAALTVTGLTLVSLIGRFGFGFLGDFQNKRYLIAIAFALQVIGIFVFSLIEAERSWMIFVFLIIFAVGYGGPLPLRPALQADYFGTKSFGTIMGLMSVIIMISSLSSPVIAGWIFDKTQSYRLAWQLFALASIPSVPLILLAKSPVELHNGKRSS